MRRGRGRRKEGGEKGGGRARKEQRERGLSGGEDGGEGEDGEGEKKEAGGQESRRSEELEGKSDPRKHLVGCRCLLQGT